MANTVTDKTGFQPSSSSTGSSLTLTSLNITDPETRHGTAAEKNNRERLVGSIPTAVGQQQHQGQDGVQDHIDSSSSPGTSAFHRPPSNGIENLSTSGIENSSTSTRGRQPLMVGSLGGGKLVDYEIGNPFADEMSFAGDDGAFVVGDGGGNAASSPSSAPGEKDAGNGVLPPVPVEQHTPDQPEQKQKEKKEVRFDNSVTILGEDTSLAVNAVSLHKDDDVPCLPPHRDNVSSPSPSAAENDSEKNAGAPAPVDTQTPSSIPKQPSEQKVHVTVTVLGEEVPAAGEVPATGEPPNPPAPNPLLSPTLTSTGGMDTFIPLGSKTLQVKVEMVSEITKMEMFLGIAGLPADKKKMKKGDGKRKGKGKVKGKVKKVWRGVKGGVGRVFCFGVPGVGRNGG